MKKFKDYGMENMGGERILPLLEPGEIKDVWLSVLESQTKEVVMNSSEFRLFCEYFIDKLPYDWDRKMFMGVKIIVRDYPEIEIDLDI